MQVFITGVSRGLGKALAQKYLELGFPVTGIGRSHDIAHPHFTFIPCDLSDPDEVQQLNLGSIEDEVIFINNAGVIGNIQRFSDQAEPDVVEVLQINTIVPMLLSRAIARAVPSNKLLIIANISSGAGRRPIPSWSAYCSSKAALDMFSQTFLLEEREKGRNIRVFSIAPGVIDTEMQVKIRCAEPSDFSSLDRFVQLNSNKELRSSDEVATKLIEFIKISDDNTAVICSL